MALGLTIAMPIVQPNVAAIERFNRALRYFYPKGTHFEHFSAQGIRITLLEIN